MSPFSEKVVAAAFVSAVAIRFAAAVANVLLQRHYGAPMVPSGRMKSILRL